MNAKNRFQAAINNEELDRVPLGYLFFGAANTVLSELNMSFKEVYYSSKGMAKAQLKALEMFGHDNVNVPWGCLNVEAEAFGSELDIKEDNYPISKGHIINSPGDIDELPIPIPERNGRMPLVLDSLKLLNTEVGETNPIIGFLSSPAVIATEIRGFENILMDTIREPKFVHKILNKTSKLCENYVASMMENGAHGIMIENSGSGADVFSPPSAEEFIKGYNNPILKKINKLGGYSILYNSSAMPFIDQDVSLHPDVYSFYMGDPAAIMEKHKWDCHKFHSKIGACSKRFCISMIKDVCLMGNVDHANNMFNGTYKDTYNEAMNCIRSSRDREGGFILSTGCEIPFDTPIKNMLALKDAVTDFKI
tara:strand:+ start:41 stop:1135 length:1095 start_codon:yes stop_codon:yes gene_type:complete